MFSFKVKSSLGSYTGYGDLCGHLEGNFSNRPVRESLDSGLLKREGTSGKEEGAERTDYLLMSKAMK